MKNSSVDLLRGPILRSLLIFALPILISNIFQQLYNTADVMIVGRFLGPDALAAVGASSAIFDLVIGFALGVGNGMGVVIARYYGAQDYRKLRQSVAATVVIGLGLSALVMILGHFGLYPLLRFLGTPASIIGQSYQYISMIVSCVGVTLGYNLGAGLLRAVGDSLTALYFLIFSALVNIVCFITQLHLGVQSAGLATIISQGLSAILCLYYIKKKVTFLLPRKSDFVLDSSLYLDLFGQGMAMGLMNSIVSIGTVTLQYAINGFGPLIISAQVAARRIMSFAVLPLTSLAAGVTTFTSQNFGAKQFKRIVAGLKQSCLVSITWSVIACVLLYVASPFLASLISGSDNAVIIDNASRYLRISSLFYPILGMLFIFRNSLQGLGKKLTPLTSSFIELLGKILFVLLVIPSMGYLGVILCEPLIWIPMTIQLYFALRKHIKRLFVS